MAVRLQLRRDTAINWTTTNPVLALGEPGVETDTLKVKVGNGITAWNSLAYSISQDFDDLTNTPTTIAGYGIVDALSLTALSAVDAGGAGSFSYNNTTGAFTYTGPSASEIRTQLSAVDAGGDGSFSYDNSTGAFTYTGPSASEVRAHFTGGTGITITDGQIATTITQYADTDVDAHLSGGTGVTYNAGTISIGQAVDPTDSVEFVKVTTSTIDSTDSSAITVETDVVMLAGLTVGNHILPSSNENIDLGSASFRFRDLYLSGTTINLGGATISAVGGAVQLPVGTNIGGVSVAAPDQGLDTTDNVTFNNITTTGYLAGPATFTIDPAAVGDDTGTVVIAGNLQVDGTTTTINSTTVEVGDKNIVLGANATADTQNNGAGITVSRPDTVDATIAWDETDDEWDFSNDISITGNIAVSGTVDSRDIATDGSKLDGIEANADVTDATNVEAAGALMDSELTNITAVKALDQGVATTDSVTFNSVTGNVFTSLIDSSDSSAITITPDVVLSAGLTVGAHITPSSTSNIDLGSSSFAFRDLYVNGTATLSGTGAIKIPAGSEAQRPTPAAGQLRFNTDASTFEGYDGVAWGAIAGNEVALLTFNFTATQAQTTFSGSDDNAASLSYTPQNLLVTLNGIVLEDITDYTATNGTSIVLENGAAAGDELNVYAFKSFTVADMVPASTGGTFAGNVAVTGALTVSGQTNTAAVLPSADATNPIGGASNRYTNLFLSGGVYLGGTTSANLLDDYEEGTWTPVDASGAGLTFTVVDARYTKVGRMVQCYAQVSYPSTADASQAGIGGLPFASASTANFSYGAFTVYTNYDFALWLNNNGGTFSFAHNLAGASVSNANVSGKQFRLVWIYDT
jgi:hypothetical protein